MLTVMGPDGTRLSARTIASAGAWIGRSATCDIVIPDPERFVSLQHCRVDFADGQFWVTDKSTNGTFLNDATAPLPKEQRQPFATGDRLRLGRFRVLAAAPIPQVAAPAASAKPLAVDSNPSPLLDPAWALPARTGEAALPTFELPDQASGRAAVDETLNALLSDLMPRDTPRVASLDAAPARPQEPRPPDRLVEFPGSPQAATAPELEQRMPPDPPPPATPPPDSGAVDDVVAAMASEIVRQPELPDQQMRAGGAQQTAVYLPDRLAAATAALAAFWCGLGVMPRNLDPATLASVMAEFGAALRESSEGFAALLGSSTQAERAGGNPFVNGRAGLRRFIEQREATQPHLDEAVRDVFALAAEREDAYVEAVRSALQHALRSMTPRAVEERFASSLRSHRQGARAVELLDLMRNMEAQLIELAEAQFRKELGERMRPRVRKLLTFERGGLHS
ncbi:MAG: type VI secretion system-associated FHA domain protein TagH [Acetobacteraceae bacterium]